jgi:hypothetical protein
VQRWAFNVQRSTFNVGRSTFSVQRSTFAVQRSPFNVRRSPFTGRSQDIGNTYGSGPAGGSILSGQGQDAMPKPEPAIDIQEPTQANNPETCNLQSQSVTDVLTAPVNGERRTANGQRRTANGER